MPAIMVQLTNNYLSEQSFQLLAARRASHFFWVLWTYDFRVILFDLIGC